MTTLEISGTPPDRGEDAIRVDHVIRGKVVPGGDFRYQSRDLGVAFATEVVLDELVTPRSEMPPLLDVKTEEIIDFLVACGDVERLMDELLVVGWKLRALESATDVDAVVGVEVLPAVRRGIRWRVSRKGANWLAARVISCLSRDDAPVPNMPRRC